MSEKPIPARWREDMLNPTHYRLPVCIEELGAVEAKNRELVKALQKLVMIRPFNWEEEGDAELTEAYRFADAALKASMTDTR